MSRSGGGRVGPDQILLLLLPDLPRFLDTNYIIHTLSYPILIRRLEVQHLEVTVAEVGMLKIVIQSTTRLKSKLR